jgi:putative ABC transport system permease protein
LDAEIPGLDADVWEPDTLFPDWETRRTNPTVGSWFVVGRLRPEVTVAQAQAEMSLLSQDVDRTLRPADRGQDVRVIPLTEYVVGPRSRLAVWLLAGAVLCVLLIATANVASLSLARSVGRARELAVRSSLGASRLRIVRQLLAESVTLAVMAGALGSAFAVGGIRIVRAFGPGDLARLDEAHLDLRVLAWALAISVMTGIFTGIAPAVMMLCPGSGKEDGRGVSGGRAAGRVRRSLVIAEFALAIVLTSAAGLLVRSWWHLERVDPGFVPGRVLSIQLTTPTDVSAAQRTNFFRDVLEQVDALPGVESAGIIGDLFASGDDERTLTVATAGVMATERLRLRIDEASERLFSTLGVPLRRGRLFSVEDGPDAPRVVIINETMASRLWPGGDPVGGRFKFGLPDSNRSWLTVVGIVGDMRREGLEQEPVAQIFEPLAQNPSRLETLLVRTSTNNPLRMAAAVQAAVRRVDKLTPLYGVATLEQQLAAPLAQRRFQTTLVIVFSVVALVMAAIGIYGLMHYSVASRTQEIGIRRAVGAGAGDIARLIAGEAVQLSIAGIVIGLVAALMLAQLGSSLLFGVTPGDPLTLASVTLFLGILAAAACYLPVRRAVKIEPTVALRRT